MTTKAIHVRLDDSVRTRLKAAAAEEERSVAFMATRAISRWLDDRENAKAAPEPTASATPDPPQPWQPPPELPIIGPVRRRHWVRRAIRKALIEHGTDVPDSRSRIVDIKKAKGILWTIYPNEEGRPNIEDRKEEAWFVGLKELIKANAVGRDGNLLWLTTTEDQP